MSKMYASDSLDRFGDDLCEELLSYLSLEDKFRFESISKQWRRVVFEKQTVFTPFSNDWLIFETILAKCANILLIGFKDSFSLEDKVIDLMIKYCTHLTDIYITFEDISIETIDRFFTTFGPQLETLNVRTFNESVDKNSIEKWLQMCVNLKSIASHSQSMPSLSLQSVTESRVPFKRLNKMELNLAFDSNTTPDVNGLDVFADKYGHQMKTFKLYVHHTHIYRRADELVNRLMVSLPRMPALVSIKLQMETLWSYELIPLLIQISINCRRLKKLSIYIPCSLLQPMHTINQHFMALKRLTITRWDVCQELLTSHSLSSLKRLTHLYIFILNRYWIPGRYLTDTFFANINHNLPKLQYLDVNRVKISDESLISLSGLRQIRGITLTAETENLKQNMSEISVNKLMANCPKIWFIKFQHNLFGV